MRKACQGERLFQAHVSVFDVQCEQLLVKALYKF